MIKDLKSAAGKKKIEVKKDDSSVLKNDIANFIGDRLVAAYKKQEKKARASDLDGIFSVRGRTAGFRTICRTIFRKVFPSR